MRPAVFLDRDGVLTVERGRISLPEEVELFPYAARCIRDIHEKGYLAVVVTNQSGVARGLFTEEELLKVHERIQKETGVDAIYYCPHYVQGRISRYAIECDCRKPDIGLINQALEDFNIDMSHSYMAGDRASDILAGKRAGVKTVLLGSRYGDIGCRDMGCRKAGCEEDTQDIRADYRLGDLRDFVRIL